jgi:hypothetical protein
MDLDLTGLWSWTDPLWGIGVLMFALATILMGPTNILTHMPTSVAEAMAPAIPLKGGARKSRTH